MELKRFISKKAQMSYLQIMILIISVFAFSYIIHSMSAEQIGETDFGKNNGGKSLIKSLIFIFLEHIKKPLLPLVSAQETEIYGCCERTIEGEFCQDTLQSKCDNEFRSVPSSCDTTSFCKKGCCYSTDTGLCSKNSPQANCNGRWFEDASCNIPECSRGCCIFGNNALWTTRGNCEVEAGFLGIPYNFKEDINSELECIFLAEKDEQGACVLGDNCIFMTNKECRSRNGDFYKDKFCSDPGLNVNCTAKHHDGCVEGEDSVYWFDSCGNREDVKEECSLFLGSVCGQYRPGIDKKPKQGDYVCRDVNCKVEINGRIVEKKNGESWCEYDGTIGDGKDVVGSRHIKHICYMGEERIEPCQDYRNQICVESKTDLGNGESFSEASCRVNNWRSCIDYNNAENPLEMAEKCNENPDCKVQGVYIDKFAFDMCVPKYPPGFDLTNEAGGRNAEMVCGMANQKCIVVYAKTLRGWKCKVNCDCEKPVFTKQMNDLCISLGDCGGYVNIEGEYTDEGYVSGGGKISGSLYKEYARPNPNQKPAEPGDLNFLASLGVFQGGYSGKNDYLEYGLGAYGVGFALQVLIKYTGYGVHNALTEAVGYTLSQGATEFLQSFGNALAVVGASLTVASIISMAFDIDYGTALIIVGAGVTTAVVTGIVSLENLIAFAKDPVVIIVLLAIYAFLKWVLKIGKTRKKVIEFKCLPWQPPAGGQDCDKCNTKDPLSTPCSEYRCKSLGQTCELINKGTEQELCVDNSPSDISAPRISPLFGIITAGYEYYNIKDNGFEIVDSMNKGCVPGFTSITFGIKTDKPSQCKISTSLQDYNDMEEYFGGSNLYLTNHTGVLNIPTPEAFKNQYNLTEEQVRKLGEINFYVKCKSVNGKITSTGYRIKSCVKQGPDLTPPRIVQTNPENGDYLGYNQTEQNLQIWINEPAQCKYSSSDQDYNLMENSFDCQTDLEDRELYGWPCNTTLDVSSNNRFYIKCKDKPLANESERNVMKQSYVYELQKSDSSLIIEDFRPFDGQEILSDTEPLTLDLEVRTSGGAENGRSICEYSFDGEHFIQFFNTFSDYHQQTFNSMIKGEYSIDLRCEDVAGNTASAKTSFNISIINETGDIGASSGTAPEITRIYYDSEDLKIWTDKPSECKYGFNENVEWENASSMAGTGLVHTTDWQLRTYYIQCKDEEGNLGEKTAVKTYD